MTHTLDSPYADLQRELDELQEQLLSLTDEADELNGQLISLQWEYRNSLGPLLSKLAGLEAKIAEFKAASKPSDATAATEAERAQERAQKIQEEHSDPGERPEPEPEAPAHNPNLNPLRKKAAKLFHPDLAEDDADLERREHFMKAANAAYSAGDAEALKRVIEDWTSESILFQKTHRGDLGEYLRASLLKAKAAVDDASERLRRLKQSEYYEVLLDVTRARDLGRDYFEDMAATIEAEIEVRQAELDRLRRDDH